MDDKINRMPIHPIYTRTPREALAGIKPKILIEKIQDRAYGYQIEDDRGHKVLIRSDNRKLAVQLAAQRARFGWRFMDVIITGCQRLWSFLRR